MNSADADTLYALLPAFIRLRDQTEGNGALQALVGVIAGQAQVVSLALDQQYDDQFIETCAPWVIPYIGDLIGFVPLRLLGPDQATRAEVADTIGYRRRKGTLSVLEQLCSDVTGWPGIAVEYFTRISTTQYVRNHLRLGNAIADVHSPTTAADVGGAFDLTPRSADVRRIDSGRGRYNVPNIGLFVWRLAAYYDYGHPARAVGANRYTFDPLGGDVPLVNNTGVGAGPLVNNTGGGPLPPQPGRSQEFPLLGRPQVPFFLQRYPLFDALPGYTAGPPVTVRIMGTANTTGTTSTTVVPSNAIGWCDLSGWTPPTATGIQVAVDPVLGRLVFAKPPDATDIIMVDDTYAFSGDYGGGPYEQAIPAGEPEQGQPVRPFNGADLSAYSDEVVEIEDSGIHLGDLALSPGPYPLVVRAGFEKRPVVAGNVTITAAQAAEGTQAPGTSVTLRGLQIGGSLIISGNGPLALRLEHCTIRGGLDWSTASVLGTLAIDHSLCGPVEVNSGVEVKVCDSAVDAGTDTAPALSAGAGAPAGSIKIARTTILGTVAARTIPLLENSIVTGPVVCTERQAGCVRYSFLPLTGSQTPRRFRCQPDLEADIEVETARAANPGLSTAQADDIQAAVEAWLMPAFTSRTPGQPGYLQLADATPDQIRAGAEDGDEMGVFYGLFSGRRESNLRYRLNEYLRIGLQAGIIHAT
jgi:hypothetical protein